MTLAWGLVILGSYYGYGRALARSVQPGLVVSAGWGLMCVWGMCVLLAACGVLLFAGWFGPLPAVAMVAGGLVLLAIERLRSDPPATAASGLRVERGGRVSGDHRPDLLRFVPVLILLVYYAGAVAWPHEVDPNDDLVSYFAFPKMLLQTGTFEDPFAFRRITSFGGQSLLQSITAVFGNELQYHFADCGIARVLLFGLLYGHLAPLRDRSPVVFALSLSFFLLLPIPRINTSSELIHAVLLLAVPLTLLSTIGVGPQAGVDDGPDGPRPGIGPPAMLLSGLVIFGASTFRPHIGLAAAMTFVLGLIGCAKQHRLTLGSGIGALLGVASTAVLLLLPWSALLYRSSGTPVFPPFRGNLSEEFASMHAVHGALSDWLPEAIRLLWRKKIVAVLLPVIVLGFRGSKICAGVASASLIATGMTAYASTALHFGYFYRYVWPILFAAMLFVGCAHLSETVRVRQEAKRRTEAGLRAVAFAAAFGLAIGVLLPEGSVYFSTVARSIGAQMHLVESPVRASLHRIYEAAQATIPEGEATLAMADAPFLFDHGRNRILTIDVPGAVSPDGELPFYEGPERVRRYLLSRGIRFVTFTPPENAILQFRRDFWLKNPRPERFYQRVWAPPMLDLMGNVQRLRRDHPLTFTDPRLEVLDLRTERKRTLLPR